MRAGPSPGQRLTAERLRRQAGWCASLGDPLYASLLERAAEDVEQAGVTWQVLAPYVGEPAASALALRLLAAVHRLVLSGRAPALAAYYPSAGGSADPGAAWPAFQSTLAAAEAECRALTARPCQTNDVGRAAPLLCGFLAVARATGRPLRVLEVGCSAGLLLRWDHFGYGWWGDSRSPVDLSDLYALPPEPARPRAARVAERAGCDLAPLDPGSDADALTLASFVWPLQVDRLRRLRGAIEVARSVPTEVQAADAGDWLEARLGGRRTGAATVVYHSVFLQYLSDRVRSRVASLLDRAGAAATVDAPMAWLRLEPAPGSYETRLTLWPGGRETLVATSDPHGGRTRSLL